MGNKFLVWYHFQANKFLITKTQNLWQKKLQEKIPWQELVILVLQAW